MSELFLWGLGLLGTAVLATLGWVAKVLTQLPVNYVPRDQVNERFSKIQEQFEASIKAMERDMEASEARSEKRFDRIDAYLERIVNKLDAKADK